MLGIVVALPVESRTLTRRSARVGQTFALGTDIRLHVAGMGPERSVAAAAALRRQGISALVNWGCAAALSPELPPGRLLLPRSFVLPDRSEVPCDSAWQHRLADRLADLAPVTAPVAGSETVLATPAAKRTLHRETGAPAADMESAFLARWCLRQEIPFVAVRAVADDAGAAIPAAVLDAADPDGGIEPLELLLQLLRHPGQIGSLWRLERQFRRARDTLTTAAARLLPETFLMP